MLNKLATNLFNKFKGMNIDGLTTAAHQAPHMQEKPPVKKKTASVKPNLQGTNRSSMKIQSRDLSLQKGKDALPFKILNER